MMMLHQHLQTPNISATLIPDSAVYALMSRVNKVVLGPVAVMADGGAICSSGCLMVAVAAKVRPLCEYAVVMVMHVWDDDNDDDCDVILGVCSASGLLGLVAHVDAIVCTYA